MCDMSPCNVIYYTIDPIQHTDDYMIPAVTWHQNVSSWMMY